MADKLSRLEAMLFAAIGDDPTKLAAVAAVTSSDPPAASAARTQGDGSGVDGGEVAPLESGDGDGEVLDAKEREEDVWH